MLSQFSPEANTPLNGERKLTLKDLFKLPADVYPVGRLDFDSEGLLILTNDPSINFKLLDPSREHEREYWVQVEGSITNEALTALSKGVQITVDGKPVQTKKAKASLLLSVADIPERIPPIRFRKNIPDSWCSLTLTEGKNRQVRKMTASAGFPTLRLIRYRIEELTIRHLQPGEMRELSKSELDKALFSK